MIEVLLWIRTVLAALLMASGLAALLVTAVGLFRFKYVLNRIHVAAKCDTLGVLLTLGSLMLMTDSLAMLLKLLLLIVLMWLSNPVSSHLVAYLEVETNPDIAKEAEVMYLDAD